MKLKKHFFSAWLVLFTVLTTHSQAIAQGVDDAINSALTSVYNLLVSFVFFKSMWQEWAFPLSRYGLWRGLFFVPSILNILIFGASNMPSDSSGVISAMGKAKEKSVTLMHCVRPCQEQWASEISQESPLPLLSVVLETCSGCWLPVFWECPPNLWNVPLP